MTSGRILVVEDLRDVRATIMGLLADEGYMVTGVATYDEAVRLLQDTRFHLCVLDVRLDEADKDNEAGIQLLHHIRELDPTIASIILTGHAKVHMVQDALRPAHDGVPPAYSFLEKYELGDLPRVVGLAFEKAIRINWSLVIKDRGQAISKLARRLRFEVREKPDEDVLAEEIAEILRKLFYDCSRIIVEPPQRGYSSAAVFKVTPWYRDKGEGEALIVKIGERGIAEREMERYKQYVAGMVGGHRVPKGLDLVYTRSMTGILYSFAGLGAARDFSDFFVEADTVAVQAVIHNLYMETCHPWQQNLEPVPEAVDLRELFFQHLWLNDSSLKHALNHIMGGRHPFEYTNDGQIQLGTDILLGNPLSLLYEDRWRQRPYVSIIHGDLQGYNVLVDRHREAWLIDFAGTTHGPTAQDYAMFEVFLLVSASNSPSWRECYQWHQSLFEAASLTAVPLPRELSLFEDIKKAHAAILTIRRLAFGDAVSLTEQEYLSALFFNALKLITIMNLPASQRDNALIAAALVAQRLSTLVS